MENIYKSLHSNQKILIYEMLTRGIDVSIVEEKLELIRCSYKGHEELIYDRDSSIMPYSLSILAGNKGITKRILESKGISVPLGDMFKVSDINTIYRAFEIIDLPIVIKPVHGSHGDFVYTNLRSYKEIEDALTSILNAYGPNSNVVVEEYFPYKEYRVFVTKNRDYAVLHRDPAHVFGNGRNNIRELIEEENYRRMNPRTNSLCEIVIDDEAKKYMKEKGFGLDYVPYLNQKVYLRNNSNVAKGGVSEDYTDRVHPTVIDIGMRVIDAFPGIPYVGVDFMCEDITKEQNDETYRIIEVNTVPGIDMHYRPAIGKSRNIAKYMVDLIYPETKGSENIELKLV